MNSNGGTVDGIGELIRAQAANTGRSYREMQIQAERAGYKLRYQTISELANENPSGFPRSMETISGLAVALDVSEEQIVLAYARSLGVEIRERSRFEIQLPTRVDELDPEISDRIISLIRSILNEGSGEHASSTADTHAAGSAAPEYKHEVALAARENGEAPANAPDTNYDEWGA